jgi:phospho-N-acetylmuramoyl-pentapeptide-transferase
MEKMMIDINAPVYIFAFALTFIITVAAERLLLPALKRGAEQPIYEEGPSWHASKSGTPTMGGLAFLIATSVALSLASIYLSLRGEHSEAISLMGCTLFGAFNALVGVLDDCKKLRRKKNGGLTPRQKLALQALLSALFLLYRHFTLGDSSVLSFSHGGVDIGVLYYPLAFLTLVGITNCANLTDGIDGLASGVAFAIGAAMFFISCALSTEVSLISAAVMGAAVGFLFFNIHPARIFMGDTGSLFLGALLAAAGIALGNPLVILVLGAVYALEGASVILQVIGFKLTRKRIFKMAPLHHHLERVGWSENRICIAAIILTLLAAIPVYIFYLP